MIWKHVQSMLLVRKKQVIKPYTIYICMLIPSTPRWQGLKHVPVINLLFKLHIHTLLPALQNEAEPFTLFLLLPADMC